MHMLPPTISAAELTAPPPAQAVCRPIAAVYPPNWACALASASRRSEPSDRLHRIDTITSLLVDIGLARAPHDTSLHDSGAFKRRGGW